MQGMPQQIKAVIDQIKLAKIEYHIIGKIPKCPGHCLQSKQRINILINQFDDSVSDEALNTAQNSF